MSNTSDPQSLFIGLIINPKAGLGGSLGEKGSDHLDLANLPAGAETGRAQGRARRCLEALLPLRQQLRFAAFEGPMGGQLLSEMGYDWQPCGTPSEPSSAEDTWRAVASMHQAEVDLLLFVGGDGTARDIVKASEGHCPALGIPAGVKMHSGVYAVSPEAAAEIVLAMLQGGLVAIDDAEVRDIDEQAFRDNRVRTSRYGELPTPSLGAYLQRTKVSGREDESLAKQDIAAEFEEWAEAGTLYLLGPGSTTHAITEHLGLDGTLLGVDAICDGELLGSDLNAAEILTLLEQHQGPAAIIVTAIGGQGHILGRGNQQLSADVIRRVGADNLHIVATRSKLAELNGAPMLVDSNDPQLDRTLAGLRPVISGYRDRLLYRVAAASDALSLTAKAEAGE